MAKVILITNREIDKFEPLNNIISKNLRKQFYDIVSDQKNNILYKILKKNGISDSESKSYSGATKNLLDEFYKNGYYIGNEFYNFSNSKQVFKSTCEFENDNEGKKENALLNQIFSFVHDDDSGRHSEHWGNIYQIYSKSDNYVFVAHEFPYHKNEDIINEIRDHHKKEETRTNLIRFKISYLTAIVEDIAAHLKALPRDLDWVFINHDCDWLTSQSSSIEHLGLIEKTEVESAKKDLEKIYQNGKIKKYSNVFDKNFIFLFQHSGSAIWEIISNNVNNEYYDYLFDAWSNNKGDVLDCLKKTVVKSDKIFCAKGEPEEECNDTNSCKYGKFEFKIKKI
jgi:hypothetical protein